MSIAQCRGISARQSAIRCLVESEESKDSDATIGFKDGPETKASSAHRHNAYKETVSDHEGAIAMTMNGEIHDAFPGDVLHTVRAVHGAARRFSNFRSAPAKTLAYLCGVTLCWLSCTIPTSAQTKLNGGVTETETPAITNGYVVSDGECLGACQRIVGILALPAAARTQELSDRKPCLAYLASAYAAEETSVSLEKVPRDPGSAPSGPYNAAVKADVTAIVAYDNCVNDLKPPPGQSGWTPGFGSGNQAAPPYVPPVPGGVNVCEDPNAASIPQCAAANNGPQPVRAKPQPVMPMPQPVGAPPPKPAPPAPAPGQNPPQAGTTRSYTGKYTCSGNTCIFVDSLGGKWQLPLTQVRQGSPIQDSTTYKIQPKTFTLTRVTGTVYYGVASYKAPGGGMLTVPARLLQ